MSSEVQICNLALAYLGDSATVASINPPEGSAQAEHCALFYPVARDTLLEMHNWSFATKRTTLALLSSSVDGWEYAYQAPNGMLTALAVLPTDSGGDYSVSYDDVYSDLSAGYSPQPFQVETISGALVILTNQENAVLRYTAHVTDTTRFSQLFTACLTWYLASMLAGPIIKGDAGSAESKRCLQQMRALLTTASVNDSASRKIAPSHNVPWLLGR